MVVHKAVGQPAAILLMALANVRSQIKDPSVHFSSTTLPSRPTPFGVPYKEIILNHVQ
jgi:hypothetical protein